MNEHATKSCSGCHNALSLDAFARRTAAPDGRQNYCRLCAAAAQAARQAAVRAARPPEPPRTEKVCSGCKQLKPLAQFPHAKRYRDNRGSLCQACVTEKTRAYRAANPGYGSGAAARYRKRHPERVRVSLATWFAKNRRRVNAYTRGRWRADVQFRLRMILRTRLNDALNGRRRPGSAVRDLGCSIPELMTWLEKQFRPGMTWANHGAWHIDHKRPLASFDLADRAQLLEAVHYTNLQPLWAQDNLHKGAKLASSGRDARGAEP